MYKRLSLKQLYWINSKFFQNLTSLYKKQRYVFLKEFLKDLWKESNECYFFEWSYPIFRCCKKDDTYILVDEKEKIEILLSEIDLSDLHNFLKNDKSVSKIKKDNKTIFQTLIDDFITWASALINDKPYIVYDIETLWEINNLKKTKFMIGYSVLSQDQHTDIPRYRPIWEDNLKKFVDHLLSFDWYIIWYNNVFFDNPVIAYNAGYSQTQIDLLNSKSIDLFLFIRNLTGKRMGLDKVSQSLISISKTLSSGLEWMQLLTEYVNTKDDKILTKVKNYCRNDVRMTLWVLLYLLKYKKLYIEGENEFKYDMDKFLQLSNNYEDKQWDKNINDWWFFW